MQIEKRIRDLTERYRDAGYFPSTCIRVFDKTKTLSVITVGEAEEDSLFDVASLTKIATATQILLLIDREVLAMDAPLPDLFPEIASDPYLRERLARVTVYRLLTHTSSITAWFPFYTRIGESFFQILRYALEHSEPTSGVCYSDLNFMLLGKLLEKTHSLPLEACLARNLVQPLNLGKMMYRPPLSEKLIPADYGNQIEMQMCRNRNFSFSGFRTPGEPSPGSANDGNCHYYFSDAAGHAGIFATAESFERLCRFYMNTDSPLLKAAQKEQAAAPGRGIGLQTGLTYPLSPRMRAYRLYGYERLFFIFL